MGNLVTSGPLVKSVPPPVKIRVIMLRNMDNLAILGPLEKDGYGILGNLAIPGPLVKLHPASVPNEKSSLATDSGNYATIYG